jgi:hypothetical protein
MSNYMLAAFCCIGVLSIWLAWLTLELLGDRGDRKELLSELCHSVNRCTTAETRCTKAESKCVELSQSARHAANDAKVLCDHVQGWHDCIKPQLPTIPILQPVHGFGYSQPVVTPSLFDVQKNDDTVDFVEPPCLDPEGRTGEMAQ